MTYAALFDLDDTLFDHRHACRQALRGLQVRYTALQEVTLERLQEVHSPLLEEIHTEVIYRRIPLREGYTLRCQRLFATLGHSLPWNEAEAVAATYLELYREHHQATPGSIDLLNDIRPFVKLGVLSNHMRDEQRDKLTNAGLLPCIDFLLTSEEVALPKPSPLMFEEALRRAGSCGGTTVMIGDSWGSDVRGALNAGIKAIWYNPQSHPCPDDLELPQLRSFVPLGEVAATLLSVVRRSAI